jgi:hypothetical protein
MGRFLVVFVYYTSLASLTGGIIEAAVCYTGDVTKKDARYNLDYYLGFARYDGGKPLTM